MGRIFISAAHGGKENGLLDPGAVVAGTTEAREMILMRDLLVAELRSRGTEVLAVPDDLSFQQTLDWINFRGQADDISLEIHADSANNPLVRGCSAFYIANNDPRKTHAELLLFALTKRLPTLPNRGPKPDTSTGFGNLAFCRQLNTDDRFIIQNQRRDIVLGLADGMIAWLQAIGGVTISYAPISIEINSQTYGEQGILVNGNAYIPINLSDLLGVDLTQIPTVRRIAYRNIVFIKAIELRDYNLSVGWDNNSRTVLIKTILKICPGSIDYIMDHGKTTDLQLKLFLKNNNAAASTQYPEIATLYREEAAIEGVDYDIAFSQMCLETNFLRFGGAIAPSQNNFASLGAAGSGPEGASFTSARLGVQAHIQHLKAYASILPLVQKEVDPRFQFIPRGIAPLIGNLSGRWNIDPSYGDKILAMLRRLYESAGLL
jgi:hypothetical protein